MAADMTKPWVIENRVVMFELGPGIRQAAFSPGGALIQYPLTIEEMLEDLNHSKYPEAEHWMRIPEGTQQWNLGMFHPVLKVELYKFLFNDRHKSYIYAGYSSETKTIYYWHWEK